MLIKFGLFMVLMFGYDVWVFDVEGYEVVMGYEGVICFKLFMLLGMLLILWGDDDCYVVLYLFVYDGYYFIGDGGFVDDDGYLFVMGCIDDVLNVVGYWLLIGVLEVVFVGYLVVVECVVIGVYDDFKG